MLTAKEIRKGKADIHYAYSDVMRTADWFRHYHTTYVQRPTGHTTLKLIEARQKYITALHDLITKVKEVEARLY